MDDSAGQRTMFVGILIGFSVYALSFVTPYLVPGSAGQWTSLGLVLVSMTFTLGWFIAVRRGFRVTKGPTRLDRKLKERRAEEREKLRKARMRR